MTIVRYAGNRMTGVSGDTKPTAGSLITGTTFHETNTDDLYIWDGDSWNVVASNTVAETLSSKTLTSPVLNGTLTGSAFLDEDNFASDSAIAVASQQSIKAYVASQVPGSQNVFNTISVSGQDNVVADAATDTLTLAAGSGMTITTTAGSDTVTFAAAGSTTFAGLTDTAVGSPASAHILIYDGSNSWDNKAVSGDVTIGADGTVAIASGVIVNADINASAAIAISKTALVAGTGITLSTNTLNVDASQGQITTVGVLNAGSITSGFGTIDTGASNITTTGTISAGNLTVTGTTTTVNSTVMTVVDPIIHLQTASGGGALGSDTNKDVGLAMQYYSGSAKTAFLGFDDSAAKLTFIPDATLSSEVVSGSVGTIVANLEGDVTGDTSGSSGSTTGNAVTATALATGRTISASGDITWTSASFTGSQNVTSVAAITADVIVNADIKSDAAIVDTKLATIATADKVAGGAIQIDSGTDGTSITIAGTDKFLVDDAGATKYINASQILTYTSGSGASESFAIAMAVAL